MNRIILSLAFASLAASASAADDGPLARKYRAGEKFRYAISGESGSDGSYAARASVAVSRGGDGIFDEAVAWSDARLNGSPVSLPAKVAAYRQHLSLDPRAKLALPDMALLGPYLGGPTDLLTFYVDAQLAIKNRKLRKAGDKARVAFGKPSSWADGRRVLSGYDCLDFELELVSLDARVATLRVDHVPPPAVCGQVPAPWMRAPVADTANNWFQVEKGGDGYEAGYAKETFRAELRIRRSDGAILSATMVNPVAGRERVCRDAALADCGPEKPFRLTRRITLTRDP